MSATVIPEEYIVNKFYQYAGYPKYIKSTNTYVGGCPVCREGNSWGRKSRLYYIPKNNAVCCHNCGWYGSPTSWIMEVDGITYKELIDQIKTYDYEYGLNSIREEKSPVRVVDVLPRDSINIFDKMQLEYYSNEPVVRAAVELVIKRKLHTACNKPKALYVSLSDLTHKKRLIIPFYNKQNKCVFYQTRRMYDDGTPKYLSKIGSEKSLFNFNNIERNTDNVFILEGPLDSCFIENSVAVAGIQEKSQTSLTKTQTKQLDSLFLTNRVWVLDSQWLDNTSLLKTELLLKQDQCVFIWPRDVGERFKDINDMCNYFKINKITSKYLLSNTYCGAAGLINLKKLRLNRF